VAINIPEALVHLRGKEVDSKRHGLPGAEQVAMSAAAWALRSPRRLGLAQRAASASRKVVGRRGRITRLPPPLGGWTRTRDAPVPPPESFRAWWTRTRGAGK
jgi:L-lactate dehydrogenase complex protein LldF